MDSDPTDEQEKKEEENHLKDLRRKQKVEAVHKDSSHLQKATLQELKIVNVEGFQIHFEGRAMAKDCVAKSSKRKRRAKSPEVIDVTSDSESPSPLEPLEIGEEIVRIYNDYIEHILVMAKDRLEDEQRWKFDGTLCSGLAEKLAGKMEKLESELGKMKKDLSQRRNYSLIEARVRQMMSQIVKMQERFDRSPNIGACTKKNCTKQQLVFCISEIDQFVKELFAITSRIRELKAMNIHKKAMEMKHRNLRIL